MSTRLLIENGFNSIVGLDPSIKLLRYARSTLGNRFDPVVGTAENLPFRQGVFGGVLTCFSLRDARNPVQSLREFARVGDHDSMLAVVDVGRPRGAVRRELVGLYVRILMPILARTLVRNRLDGNPFRMIVPTFDRLLTNPALATRIRENFGPVRMKEFLFGGLVVFEATEDRAEDTSKTDETSRSGKAESVVESTSS